MRLLDLDPLWCSDFGAPAHAKQGVTFLCPHCRKIRLGVWFDVPIHGSPPINIEKERSARLDCDHPEHQPELAEVHFGGKHWHREGDSFENLTLTPSLDCSHFGHWHGNVVNGQIVGGVQC